MSIIHLIFYSLSEGQIKGQGRCAVTRQELEVHHIGFRLENQKEHLWGQFIRAKSDLNVSAKLDNRTNATMKPFNIALVIGNRLMNLKFN